MGPRMKRTRFLDADLLYSAAEAEFKGAYSPLDKGPPARRAWDKGGGEDEREGDSCEVTIRRWRDMLRLSCRRGGLIDGLLAR